MTLQSTGDSKIDNENIEGMGCHRLVIVTAGYQLMIQLVALRVQILFEAPLGVFRCLIRSKEKVKGKEGKKREKRTKS